MRTETWNAEPIAIVGSGCRLPGHATSPSKLWDLLQNPRDVLSDISMAKSHRFNARGFYNENGDHHGSTNVQHAYLCEEDHRAFDHDFFGIHRREAEAMDPQQKMLLEVVYEAIEAAGYSMHALRGSQTGVFVGQMNDDFKDSMYRDLDIAPQYTATGISRAITANRVSYFFDWRGPSVNLDTACSSSLVALHQAVQSLRSGDISMAVAAGLNLILGPESFVLQSKLHMLSPTGRCHMWDARADGYARGEGVAVVVLKPLHQALADNDRIECIIRETGVSQNGRTPGGLTVPNAVSQAELIRSTYARCGLDPTRPQDRCQYFEAHGTGTPAGDPKEAQAIRDVFFPTNHPVMGDPDNLNDQVLYVGSVKTVVGHTEGAAGLVAVLKASLAIQHAQISPNMHFERLNPAVEPFYNPHLRVPTELTPWPADSVVVRRASVNSFGLGGTNAHVILESWDSGATAALAPITDCHAPKVYGPFTVSASSRTSLARRVSALFETLAKSSPSLDIGHVAWTLQSRRTEFAYRAAFCAASKQELMNQLEGFVVRGGGDSAEKTITVSSEFPLRIIGVFTGQGAQWYRMGAKLYTQSPLFRRTIQQLEDSLAQSPDPPSWSLTNELLGTSSTESRIHEAEVAQPLTTAVQIALVDMLQASGVLFTAVVGHSSGEITAAYASGYISALDAIRIAYYRGVHSSLAQSPTSGESGSMMAAAMSFIEATAFCQRPDFTNRITVAASNAPSSVTFSGDSSAILEAKEVLDRSGIFARVLRVNKAYHSHHMKSCAAAYLASLQRCAIQPKRGSFDGGCTWYSSVHGPDGRSIQNLDSLRDRYWVDNMVKPVLFYQAVERAAREEPHCFDLALEIGPHPALRGPFTDSFSATTGVEIPYFGLLKRGEDDCVAFCDAFASTWTIVRSPVGVPSAVDWDAFRMAFYGQAGDERMKRHQSPLCGGCSDLPPYSWDHDQPLLFESNQYRAWCDYNRPIHPLLGRAIQHGCNGRDSPMMTWRNILKIGELEWLRGHQFQHQVVFPAAGYISMVIDAAGALAEVVEPSVPDPALLVELTDLRFHHAITIDDDASVGVEVVMVMRALHSDTARHTITAEYLCYSGDPKAPSDNGGTRLEGSSTTATAMTLCFSGRASIRLVPPAHPDQAMQRASPLPARNPTKLPLTSLDTGRFYSHLSSLGLQYSGDFLAKSVWRRRSLSTVVVERPAGNLMMRVHPAALDAAFHGIFAAYSYPGDGRMSAPHLPSAINRVRVDMTTAGRCSCFSTHPHLGRDGGPQLIADCHARQNSFSIISGDVDLFCAGCGRALMQVESLAALRISKPSSRDDRSLFARTVWDRDLQSSGLETQQDLPTPGYPLGRAELSEICDRMAYFYLLRLISQNSEDESRAMARHFQYLLDWAINQIVPTVQAGLHTRVRPEWATDTHETIQAWRAQYGECVEIQLIHAVGECLPSVMRASCGAAALGSTTILDTLMQNGMLTRFYSSAAGMWQANQIIGAAVKQLAHRYPHMRILEIGAGTGAGTACALAALDGRFASYTFTDVSAAFFHDAQVKFASSYGADKMRYAVLDIERDPGEPSGFLAEHGGGAFDLVIAYNVLHATRSLPLTLANCRRLLRPGGFLVLGEMTSDSLYAPFIVCGLPGWWLGRDGDGRMYSPTVSESRWDFLLKQNGFSGVDYVARDTRDENAYLNSVMVSQAMDHRVEFLRAPLQNNSDTATSLAKSVALLDNLVIIGVSPMTGQQIARTTASEMGLLLEPWARNRPIILEGWEALETEASIKAADSKHSHGSIIRPGSAVIILSESQDDGAREDWYISQTRLLAMQAVFHDASRVLWVTQGRHTGRNPRANMMAGIGRSLLTESPHLRLLFVDVDPICHAEKHAMILSEMFLRMVCLDRPEYGDVLWSNETELAVRASSQSGGQVEVLYVPRIKPDHLLNRRLASGSRVVTEDVPLGSADVKIARDEEGRFALQKIEMDRSGVLASNSERKIVHFITHFSTLFAVSSGSRASPLYICLGSVVDKPGKIFLAVSPVNASSLYLPCDRVAACNRTIEGEEHVGILRQICTAVVCEDLLADLHGSSIWLHDAPVEFAEVALQIAKARGVDVFLSASCASTAATYASYGLEAEVTVIHPRCTEREVEAVIPANVQRFVVAVMDDDDDARSLQDTVVRSGLIPRSDIRNLCLDISRSGVFALQLGSNSRMWDVITSEITCPSSSSSSMRSGKKDSFRTAIDIRMIPSISGYHPVTTVVDWKGTATRHAANTNPGTLSAQIRPLGLDGQLLFSPQKTCLLVGFASDVGLSLIEWMAGQGARHFAIIARSPRIDPAVRQHLARLGVAQLETWAVDISDKQALRVAHADMVARMPPIVGVANAAMVLRDRPFGLMTAEDFSAVLRPKAQGTLNLDELFRDRDAELDFFVLFASAATIVGNAGQTNYNAANMFMASVADRRRRRGAAASVIYLSRLFGIGHVARSMEKAKAAGMDMGTVEAQLQRVSAQPISEDDLHASFAEAVISGRPESSMDPGIIVGLGAGENAPWRHIPLFSSWLAHCASRRHGPQAGDEDASGGREKPGAKQKSLGRNILLRRELAAALDGASESTSEAVLALLQDAFVARLGVILQTDASKIEKNVPLVALGIDSLVAVEIRSWFLQELSVDIPILKMLGGDSLADVCRVAMSEFAETLKKQEDSAPQPELVPSESLHAPSPGLSEENLGTVEQRFSAGMNDDEQESSIARLTPALTVVPTSEAPVSTSTPPSSPPPSSPENEMGYVRIGDMSSAQARLYFLHQYLEEKSPFTIGYVGKYRGRLEANRLRRSLWQVCAAHEALRSCYYIDSDSHRPLQGVLPRASPQFEHRQILDQSEVKAEIETQRRLVFDIEHGHLLKVTVLSLGPALHHVIFLHHHIALDGVSWLVFLRDLNLAYAGHEVSPLQQSIDMSAKQHASDSMSNPEKLSFWAKMYQQEHEPLPLFPFSKVKNRQVLKKYEAETFDMELEPDLARRVQQAAASLGVTPFHFYLSALAVFLQRTLGVADFSIGIVDANRPDPQDASTLGYFLNMLPLRFRLDSGGKEEGSFSQLVERCRNMVLDALTHARVPFDSILDHLHVSRAGSHHPLFQVALDYRQGYAQAQQLFDPDATIEWDAKQSITARNPYDIFINVTPTAGGPTFIHWTTQKYLYHASDSRLMMTWYARILDALTREPSATCIARCPVATEEDLRDALNLGVGKQPPAESWPVWTPGTLIHQVDTVARQHSDSIALVDDYGGRLTYSQMMARTQRIAHPLQRVLRDGGVDLDSLPLSFQPDAPSLVVVATLIPPMNDYVCCLLAILRLGVSCIGLDLRNPEERLAVMLLDCRPKVLVCNNMTSNLADRLAISVSAQVINIDALEDPAESEREQVQNRSNLDQCAVILYTSGSTGIPKGVLLSHRNLHSHIAANTALFGLGPSDVILQQTSPGFDFCLDQVFHALCNGGRLVVVGQEGRGDPAHLARLMLNEGVTVTTGCPSEYLALLNYGAADLRRCQQWRFAFSGGEKLTPQLRHGFRRLALKGLRFVNVYGPTEVTIACARGPVPYMEQDEDVVGEGGDYLLPMPGYEVLVVDEETMQPVPVGFPGEVCIAGDGVALGYLNREEETRLRFVEVEDPKEAAAALSSPLTLASATTTDKTIRFYRSGDHGRLLPDGSIHLLGRLVAGNSAGQVKIRGMRVELDEIASVMIRESAGALAAAAISFRPEGPPTDLLVAFVVFNAELQSSDGRAQLMRQLKTSLPLPAHMQPTVVVAVDELPMNVNGKLDRAAIDRLRIPAEAWTNGSEYIDGGSASEGVKKTVGNLSPTELRMREIWRELLHDDAPPQSSPQGNDVPSIPDGFIDADSDFFQVGGNSMLTLKLRSAIQRNFGVIIPVPELFRLRTLSRIAARVAPAATLADSKYSSEEASTVVRKPSPKVDWAAEVASLLDGISPPPAPSPQLNGITPLPPARNARVDANGIRVALTGATGFLGRHILQALATDPRVSEIHCLAVRNSHRFVATAGDRDNNATKIVPHAGDLALPLLGLSAQAFAHLAATVDVVIHNGAAVSFLQPYEALRGPNVMGTRTIVELALVRRVPVHFVSSAGVACVLLSQVEGPGLGGVPVPTLPPSSVAGRLPPVREDGEQVLDGYALSKWAGEALLERAAKEHGLPVCVHRPASIVGGGAPELDVIGSVLRYSRLLGAVPALASPGENGQDGLLVQGAFDFVLVERVAADLVQAALASAVSGSSSSGSVPAGAGTAASPVRFVHHCGKDKISPGGLQAYMEENDARPFAKMALGDWLHAAKAKGLPPLLYQYMTESVREGRMLYLPVISSE